MFSDVTVLLFTRGGGGWYVLAWSCRGRGVTLTRWPYPLPQLGLVWGEGRGVRDAGQVTYFPPLPLPQPRPDLAGGGSEGHLVRVPHSPPWVDLVCYGNDEGRGRYCLVMLMKGCLVTCKSTGKISFKFRLRELTWQAYG